MPWNLAGRARPAASRWKPPAWSRVPGPMSGAGDDLLGSQRVGGGEVHRVTVVDHAEAVDVVQVQVAAGGQHMQLAGAIGVGGLDLSVVRRRPGAVNGGAAAIGGQGSVNLREEHRR